MPTLYPRINTSTKNSYHPDDVITSQDKTGSITLDLSSFVQRSSATFDDTVYLTSGTKINYGGKVSEAYGVEDEMVLYQNQSKLSKVTFDDMTQKTKITGDLNLEESTVFFSDESIPVQKITDLTEILTGILRI